MPTQEFHRHPDGVVYVRTNSGNYVDTLENFEKDFGVTLVPLPEGANEQIYTQGRRHAYMGDGNVVDGGPVPCALCDALIANVSIGLNAQVIRRAEAGAVDANNPS